MEGKIVCPACSGPGRTPTIISVQSEDEETYCPNCKRRYRLLTRQIQEVTSERLNSGRARYQIVTVEDSDEKRTRPRSFEAQTNLKLQAQMTVTLVWRGKHLVGLADQSNIVWYNIEPQPPRFPQLNRLMSYLAWVCLFIAALQLGRLVPAWSGLFDNYGLQALIVIAIAVLVLMLPLLRWITEMFKKEDQSLPFG
jgi:hypothetical protein